MTYEPISASGNECISSEDLEAFGKAVTGNLESLVPKLKKLKASFDKEQISIEKVKETSRKFNEAQRVSEAVFLTFL